MIRDRFGRCTRPQRAPWYRQAPLCLFEGCDTAVANASVEASPPRSGVATPLGIAFLSDRAAARSRDRPRSWSSGRTSSAIATSTGSTPRSWRFPFSRYRARSRAPPAPWRARCRQSMTGQRRHRRRAQRFGRTGCRQRDWWWRRGGSGGDREGRRAEGIDADQLQLNVPVFGVQPFEGADEEAFGLRQRGPLMDYREAIDICGGGVFEGEAGKAVAGRRGDDPQQQPDVLGRPELAIAPGAARQSGWTACRDDGAMARPDEYEGCALRTLTILLSVSGIWFRVYAIRRARRSVGGPKPPDTAPSAKEGGNSWHTGLRLLALSRKFQPVL
jgi:hypothetical protein